MQTILSSKDNPHIKQLVRLLTQKRARDTSGCFALEGARLCLDALYSGLVPQQLFLTQQAAEKYTQINPWLPQAKQVFWLDATLSSRIADTKTPQGIFAIFEKPTVSPLIVQEVGRYLLLSSVRDPGNVGAILRTAEALGIDGVYASADCADFFSPKVLRAAMGAVFRLPVNWCNDMPQQIRALQEQNVKVYAAALTPQAVPVQNLQTTRSSAIVIGNEGNGLEADVIAACDQTVIIPMAGKAESLNAAVAAGILLWEFCGPRSKNG